MAKPPEENVLVRMTTRLVEELDKCIEDVNQSFLSMSATRQLDQLQTGNTIHLISKLSGKALQLSTNGLSQLDLNAKGNASVQAFNTQWTVIRESKHLVRLHNADNYLAVKDGQTCVLSYCEAGHAGPETVFTVSEVGASFVRLRSKTEPECIIGADKRGLILPANKTTKDESSQFHVRGATSSQYLTKQHSYPPTTSPRKDEPCSLRQLSSPSNAFLDLNSVNTHDDADRYWGDNT